MSLSGDERHILRHNLGVRAPVFLRRLVAEREEELRRQAAQARDDFDTERQQAAAQELKRIREIKANATSAHDLVPALSAEQRAWVFTEDPKVRTALRYELETQNGPVRRDYMPPSTVAAPPPTNWREAPASNGARRGAPAA
jgi:hypothetical protein